MDTLRLLPNRFKKIGWYIFAPSLVLGIIYLLFNSYFEFQEVKIPVIYNSGFPLMNDETGLFKLANVDLIQNLLGILIIVGGMLVGFSEEKNEDEYISSLRLKSVLWSLAISYGVVLILFVCVFGSAFFTVMILAMYLPLLLYIFRFHYLLLQK